jgi:hypothetical protein
LRPLLHLTSTYYTAQDFSVQYVIYQTKVTKLSQKWCKSNICCFRFSPFSDVFDAVTYPRQILLAWYGQGSGGMDITVLVDVSGGKHQPVVRELR